MDYSNLASYVNWARLGVLVIVTVLAVLGAVRRSRPKASSRDAAFGIAWVVVVVAMGVVASATDWILVGLFAVVGIVIGLVLGTVRPLMAWIAAFAQVYFTMALLWDAGGYFAAGLAVLAFAAGMSLSQALRTSVGTSGPAPVVREAPQQRIPPSMPSGPAPGGPPMAPHATPPGGPPG